MTRAEFQPVLIATDVDGTLLDEDENVTPRTRAAVRAAIDAGTTFILAKIGRAHV